MIRASATAAMAAMIILVTPGLLVGARRRWRCQRTLRRQHFQLAANAWYQQCRHGSAVRLWRQYARPV